MLKNNKIIKKLFTVPGSLFYTGNKNVSKVTKELIAYTEKDFKHSIIDDYNDEILKNESFTTKWLNLSNAIDEKEIEKLGEVFYIHTMTLEDILNVHQNAKFENNGDYIFMPMPLYHFNEKNEKLNSEQLCIIYKENMIITLQEGNKNFFHSLINRISKGEGRVRRFKSRYLLFLLLDAVFDNYQFVLSQMTEKVDNLEVKFADGYDQDGINNIYQIRAQVIKLKSVFRNAKDMINEAVREEHNLQNEKVKHFYRDLFDKAQSCYDNVIVLSEYISNLLELNMNLVSYRMNKIMQTLTIVSTVFIPLTFLAGIYGMNFKYMPELELTYSYPILIGLMFVIAVFLIFIFKKKKWF